jgi:hypothetical protein
MGHPRVDSWWCSRSRAPGVAFPKRGGSRVRRPENMLAEGSFLVHLETGYAGQHLGPEMTSLRDFLFGSLQLANPAA